MSAVYPEKIKKEPNGSYSWFCSIDPDYYRKSIRPGFIACIFIAVFLLLFGAVLAWQYHNWEYFLIVAGCTGVFMLIALFWKRSNKQGALAGMIAGAVMVFVWKYLIAPMGGALAIYELLPAFIIGLIVNVVVSLVTAEPDAKIVKTFDEVKANQ